MPTWVPDWPSPPCCQSSLAGWECWISSAASVLVTILLASALNFGWICNGGMIFWHHGMEWAFGYSQGCPLPQISKWRRMRLAPWALGHITIIMNGSVVPGYLHRQTSSSLTKNCFLWWWLLMYGALSGQGDTFFFSQITRLLYTSCLPGCRTSHALCIFSVIYSLLLLASTLLSLHSISPAFITI